MSAMLEAYDMPMLDYPTDHDIQMHPSSSDQWFPDESKMEEDAPGVLMKTENYSPLKSEQMKTDAYPQDKSEVTIEIDMEPFSEHHNDEYEMQEDEQIHNPEGETQDVEVYDVSLAQSPFMAASVDISQVPPSDFLGPFNHTNSSSHSNNPSPVTTHNAELPPQETHVPDISALEDIPAAGRVQLENYGTEEVHPHAALEGHEPPEPPESSNMRNEPHSQEDFEGNYESSGELLESAKNLLHTENSEALTEEHPESVRGKDVHEQDNQPESDVHPTSENSVGDPHEISEGVYIDPPPPVLLSVATEDQFHFSFFNEPPDRTPSHSSGAVFLQHFPTLYYEPLSTVFDALREEEYVQSTFHLPESELVLDAVDLQLTISEDNVYAREVTLHDLNVLHDVSGISGQLRMRLYASAPRFITRYQHLQDQISRLNLEQPTVEPSSELNGQIEIRREGHDLSQEENSKDRQESTGDGFAGSLQTPDQPLIEKEIVQKSEDGSTDVGTVTLGHDQGSYPPLPAQDDAGQGSEGAHDDDDGSEEPAVDSESFLPPLPTEPEDDDEQDASFPQGDIAQLDCSSNDPVSGDVLETSEHGTTFTSSNEDNQPDPAEQEVHQRDENDSYEEDQKEEGGHEIHEEEEEIYEEYEEENELDDEEAKLRHEQVENAQDEEENGERVTHGDQADEEYLEDPAFPEEEDTASYSTAEDIDHVGEGGQDDAQETVTTDAAAGDLEPTLFNNADDTAKLLADSGSDDREEVTHEHTGVDDLDSKELDKETDVSTNLDNYTNLENGNEFESSNVWEPSTGPPGHETETYTWEDNVDQETWPDAHWEGQDENALSNSNHSSVTLSSKTSKRSFDEFEVDDGLDNENGQWSPPSSPDPKRSRVQ